MAVSTADLEVAHLSVFSSKHHGGCHAISLKLSPVRDESLFGFAVGLKLGTSSLALTGKEGNAERVWAKAWRGKAQKTK